MDIRQRYPRRAFLLKDKRLMVRRGNGELDPTALRKALDLLPRYGDVDPMERQRLQKAVTRVLCVGDVVRKGAWSFGDLEAAGRLHTKFGFPVVVEVFEGEKRTGTDKNGERWEHELKGMAYGFLPDTIAADEEELDVILGKDITAPLAFVLDQGDEIKLALGYSSIEEAQRIYCDNWPPNLLKGVYEVPMGLVRALLCAEPGTLSKAIKAAIQTSAVVVMDAGEVVGTITKGVMGVGGFSGGGEVLPAQAGELEEDDGVTEEKDRGRPQPGTGTSHAMKFLPVEKAAEGRPFIVYGVVLEPEPNQGAGDLHRETYSVETVRDTAHEFTAFHMNLDDQHGEFLPPTKAAVVESYLTKAPEIWGARTVPAGSWVMGIRVFDAELQRQILAGEKTGLSIEGFAQRVPNVPAAA